MNGSEGGGDVLCALYLSLLRNTPSLSLFDTKNGPRHAVLSFLSLFFHTLFSAPLLLNRFFFSYHFNPVMKFESII